MFQGQQYLFLQFYNLRGTGCYKHITIKSFLSLLLDVIITISFTLQSGASGCKVRTSWKKYQVNIQSVIVKMQGANRFQTTLQTNSKHKPESSSIQVARNQQENTHIYHLKIFWSQGSYFSLQTSQSMQNNMEAAYNLWMAFDVMKKKNLAEAHTRAIFSLIRYLCLEV